MFFSFRRFISIFLVFIQILHVPSISFIFLKLILNKKLGQHIKWAFLTAIKCSYITTFYILIIIFANSFMCFYECERYQIFLTSLNYYTLLHSYLKSHSSALLISRYILRLRQCGRCCFCATCPNRKMYLKIRSTNEGALTK